MAIEADALSTFQESRPQYSEWRRITRIFFKKEDLGHRPGNYCITDYHGHLCSAAGSLRPL